MTGALGEREEGILRNATDKFKSSQIHYDKQRDEKNAPLIAPSQLWRSTNTRRHRHINILASSSAVPGFELSELDDPRLPKLPIVILFSLFLSMIAFE